MEAEGRPITYCFRIEEAAACVPLGVKTVLKEFPTNFLGCPHHVKLLLWGWRPEAFFFGSVLHKWLGILLPLDAFPSHFFELPFPYVLWALTDQLHTQQPFPHTLNLWWAVLLWLGGFQFLLKYLAFRFGMCKHGNFFVTFNLISFFLEFLHPTNFLEDRVSSIYFCKVESGCKRSVPWLVFQMPHMLISFLYV